MKVCAKEASTVTFHRDYGSRRMKTSADEFDAIFTSAVKYLIVGGAVAGGLGILASVATGGMAAPLVGVGVAGGLAAFLVMIAKWISANERLKETDSWIMRDRVNFRKLLLASSLLEEALKELERLGLHYYEANTYLRKHCGFPIDVDSLMEIQRDLKRTLDILRRKGLESGEQEAIQQTTTEVENRIQEFLEGNQHITGWWDATLYTDTQGIGRVGGEVAWNSRKRPPVGDLLRELGHAISNDEEMEPIRKMGKLYGSY